MKGVSSNHIPAASEKGVQNSHTPGQGLTNSYTLGEPMGSVHTHPLSWGPWAGGIDQAERMARCRGLRALVAVIVGPRGNDLCRALQQAESDIAALTEAANEFGRLPTIPQRKVLASFANLNKGN